MSSSATTPLNSATPRLSIVVNNYNYARFLPEALDSALAVGASIYTVDMSATEGSASRNPQSAAILRNFAEKSGARFVSTPGGPALRDAFASIAQELGHQYTIAYRPVNRARDGRWRTIDVRFARDDLTVRTRKGYRAPKK